MFKSSHVQYFMFPDTYTHQTLEGLKITLVIFPMSLPKWYDAHALYFHNILFTLYFTLSFAFHRFFSTFCLPVQHMMTFLCFNLAVISTWLFLLCVCVRLSQWLVLLCAWMILCKWVYWNDMCVSGKWVSYDKVCRCKRKGMQDNP